MRTKYPIQHKIFEDIGNQIFTCMSLQCVYNTFKYDRFNLQFSLQIKIFFRRVCTYLCAHTW